MKKAYSFIPYLNTKAVQILKNNRIQVTNSLSDDIPNTKELVGLLREYDILIIGIKIPVKKDILENIQHPRIIATLSVGLDHIDSEIIESSLIKVVHVRDANTVSVAEHIFALMLALSKRLYELNHLVIYHKGDKSKLHEGLDDISKKKLGLIGAGNITNEVIKIAKVFHMQISCYTEHPEKHHALLEEGVTFKTLYEVLKESDIINVSVPLTDKTENLISKDKIDWIQPTAVYIHTSRAGVVDVEALIHKADQCPGFYLGLDIDMDGYDELFSQYRKNVIITPHIAGISKPALERMGEELANRIVRCLAI